MNGEDSFQWSGLMIGLSLGAFGVFHAGAQAFLTGPAVARLGERWALVVGMACELTALVIVGFASQGWILFALAPLFALGGIGMPALQSLTTRQVDADKQGQVLGGQAYLDVLRAADRGHRDRARPALDLRVGEDPADPADHQAGRCRQAGAVAGRPGEPGEPCRRIRPAVLQLRLLCGPRHLAGPDLDHRGRNLPVGASPYAGNQAWRRAGTGGG